MSMPEKCGLILLNVDRLLSCKITRNGNMMTLRRPHVRAFLDTCFSHFHVMVWSTEFPHQVQSMIDDAFTLAQQKQLYGIWNRETWGEGYFESGHETKNLSVVLKKLGNTFSERNVMIIGDREDNVDVFEFRNWVKVKSFDGYGGDRVLQDLAEWVDYVAVGIQHGDILDIRDVINGSPF